MAFPRANTISYNGVAMTLIPERLYENKDAATIVSYAASEELPPRLLGQLLLKIPDLGLRFRTAYDVAREAEGRKVPEYAIIAYKILTEFSKNAGASQVRDAGADFSKLVKESEIGIDRAAKSFWKSIKMKNYKYTKENMRTLQRFFGLVDALETLF
ncbi:MAG TPA: hypothetical protein VJJ76_01705 [archaeon]|nr:hypothetical protein [archaeon]